MLKTIYSVEMSWGYLDYLKDDKKKFRQLRLKNGTCSMPFDGAYEHRKTGEFIIYMNESNQKFAYDKNMQRIPWKKEFESNK